MSRSTMPTLLKMSQPPELSIWGLANHISMTLKQSMSLAIGLK